MREGKKSSDILSYGIVRTILEAEESIDLSANNIIVTKTFLTNTVAGTGPHISLGYIFSEFNRQVSFPSLTQQQHKEIENNMNGHKLHSQKAMDRIKTLLRQTIQNKNDISVLISELKGTVAQAIIETHTHIIAPEHKDFVTSCLVNNQNISKHTYMNNQRDVNFLNIDATLTGLSTFFRTAIIPLAQYIQSFDAFSTRYKTYMKKDCLRRLIILHIHEARTHTPRCCSFWNRENENHTIKLFSHLSKLEDKDLASLPLQDIVELEHIARSNPKKIKKKLSLLQYKDAARLDRLSCTFFPDTPKNNTSKYNKALDKEQIPVNIHTLPAL